MIRRPPASVGRRHPAVLVGVLVLTAAAVVGCGAQDPPQAPGSQYVALGDSYTAGPGMDPITDRSCRRSGINYPSLVAAELKITELVDRSCAGARITNLEAPQQYRDPRTGRLVEVNDPQLDAVDEGTELVTIGMGLNDHAVSTGLLLICNVIPPRTEPNDVCKEYLQLPEATIHTQIRDVATDLEAALRDIARKAPEARIVVVGYPRVVPDEGSCPDLFPVPAKHLTRLRGAMQVANEAWREAAAEAGALYADMYTPSEGHDVCSDDPWISGYRGVPGKAAGLHPLPAYPEAVAAEVVELLRD